MSGSTLSPLQRAFLALEEAEARLAAIEQAAREPIAVIGLGCRVPGGGVDAASFWRLLREGRDAIGPVPADRWDADALFDPDPETPGRIVTRHGGFLDAVDRFDPGFFGIAPREAEGMDPQQRLLLEVTWEALEHAGQAPDRLERSATAVYFGMCSADYAYLQLGAGDPTLLDAHFTSGIAHSIASGRLSYLLGLQGPSLTIDTACSSSLVAVHLACQALRAKECRMAIAGGVNLILTPDLYIALSHSRMLAPDGRCKTFDAAADGFARGEGCGVVVLKRLGDAAADGDRVLATICGSAVNQDGPSSGLTAPNGPAQEAVVREALARAGLAPRAVGYIEAHGTGTELGDPLEVQALGAVFAADRDPARPLLIGSVKTNVGHLEGAAGVTGLIKLVLALQQRQIPPHLHFRDPSPHIPWADLPLEVPTELTAWEPIGGRRIAGVSSFGFSGTNAHVILAEAPALPALPNETGRPARLFAISARDEQALCDLARRHVAALAGRTDDDLPHICHTAGAGRAHFAVRATVLAHTLDELRQRLAVLAAGGEGDGVRRARVTRRDPPKVAFLFTGQGAQYPGMARGLYDSAPVFRAALDRCAELVAPELERPLLEVLFGDDSGTLDETAYTQPALFAVEYALTELWRSWGVTPSVVMGHSVGELVAACVAGVLELEPALRLVARRGRLMQSLPPGGAMAALFAPEQRVAEAIAAHREWLSVAAVNGPEQTVISGRAAEVESLCGHFATAGVRTQLLPVSHAFHSPLVEPILDDFERVAAALPLSPPRLRLVSNLTGRLAAADEITEPRYWRRQVREAVRFGDGLRALAALGPDCAVEIGPHPTLLSFAAATLGDAAPAPVPSLRKGQPDRAQMLDGLATLYLAGAELDWNGIDHGLVRRIVDLPSYPFRRERIWFQARSRPAEPPRGRQTGHPLLGTRLRSAVPGTLFEARVGADEPAYVRQHRVLGHVLMPATAYLETLLAAAGELFGAGPARLEDVTIKEAMLLDDDGAARALQVVCGPAHDGVVPATLSSVAESAGEDEPWKEHVSARLGAAAPAPPDGPSLDELRARCRRGVTAAAHYARCERRGLDFGDGFKVVRQLWSGVGEALGEIEMAPDLAAGVAAHRVHPLLLDGCLQVLAAALPDDDDALFLPIGIGRVTLWQSPGSRCWSHVTVRPGGGETRRGDLRVLHPSGAPVAELVDVQLKRVTRDVLERIGERWLDQALSEIVWREAPLAPSLDVLCGAAAAALESLRSAAALDAYDRFMPQLDARCAVHVLRAMTRLGWTPVPGEPVAADVLAGRLGVAARHRRLFGRLLAILAEDGWLARAASGFTVARPLPSLAPEPGGVHPIAAAELELTDRVGGELAAALSGEREPMQLLFPGGSLETAERLYRDTPPARVWNGLVAAVIAAAAAARDSGRLLRILEVGAGTGGTTAHVLPRLPAEGVEYTFTDVGPLFVARARERFGGTPFLRFEVLDLERDPEAQGFPAGGFDVVIAANVIHATADLGETLTRVRRLLAPGGLLAMLEVTAPQRWFDLTVGLTEGWWAFTDTDLRPDYPTLGRERWLALLGEQGFGAARAVPEGRGHAGSLGLQSLFLARAASAARAWLLVADRAGAAAALATRLTARGDACTLVAPGADVAAELARPAVREVVHLGALDAAAWESTSAAELAAAEARGVGDVLRLAQALVSARPGPAPRLWIVTRGGQQAGASDRALSPAQAPVWGLARTLRLEHPELRSVSVDLDPGAAPDEVAALLAELDGPGAEPQVALRQGTRLVARLAPLRRARVAARPPAPYRLVPVAAGSLDELVLVPGERHPPGPGEVEIEVAATGLNFKDVLSVLGLYPGEAGPLGGECAGMVSAVGAGVTHVRRGDQVMAVAPGSFASHVVARAELVQPRPAGLGAVEGASFPIAFLTAGYCLGNLAALGAGERVLVHAAAGGVGMAAVRLARRAGAEVFATAGSAWKRDMLSSMGVAHVFDSRSPAFADAILARTGGRGVDVVLNSLSGELIDASFRALARGGRFVEIGKRGIKDPAWVAALDRGVRYFVVDWGVTAATEPALIGGLFARLTGELGRGTLAPLPRHVFDLDDAARAFRFMAQARHAGKIVIRHRPETMAIRPDGSYLVTGGLSGLGPVLARWLAERGAGRVVLVGRRGTTAEAAPVIAALGARGIAVVAEALDVTDEAGLKALLERLRAEGPPLRGVVHGAGVLEDAAVLQQDTGSLARVLAPKVRGGWLLDRLTRPDPLDWFVLFSSVASVLGSPGQANHAAANAFLDLLARERQGRGQPGLSINWGAWTEVGAAADPQVTERIAAQGMRAVTPAQGLVALERLLGQEGAQVAVLPIDWARYLEKTAAGVPPPFLAEVAGAPASRPAAVTRMAGTLARARDLRKELAIAPPGRWRPMVAAFVRERALGALGLDPLRPVDPRTPLGELGLDSLLAVELRNTLGTALGLTLPATLLFDFPTIEALTEYILSDVLAPAERSEEAPPPASGGSLVGSIEELSDEEVEQKLARAAKGNP